MIGQQPKLLLTESDGGVDPGDLVVKELRDPPLLLYCGTPLARAANCSRMKSDCSDQPRNEESIAA